MIGILKSLCVSLFILSLSGNAHARIDGVDYTQFIVDGEMYSVPVYNPKIEHKFYMIKKMLEGDKTAREFVLGGKEEVEIFIGDGDRKLWLTVNKTDEFVTEVR